MNKKERANITRALDCLNGVPLPHDGTGTKTASVEGAFRASRDIREARRLFYRWWETVVFSDPPTEQEAELSAFESWFATRQRENWA